MLTCRGLTSIASDYIDGELSAVNTLSVKVHLLMCGDCRTFIGNLRTSLEFMQAHSSQQADEAFVQKIDQRVAEALAAQKSPGRPPEES